MLNLLGTIGHKFLALLDYFGGVSSLMVYSIIETLFGDKRGNRVVKDVLKKQILFTGYDALPIIGIIALSLGAVVIIQTVTALTKIGAEDLIGKILIIVIMREFGPILTAIIVIGRSGTAIATEIGNMMVNNEIEAIEVMGLDPLKFIVFPRIVGGMISVMALTVYFSLIGILGGFLVASFVLTIPFSKFFSIIFSNMNFLDVLILLIKSTVFGAIISTISVYHGFKIELSYTEVPQAVTRAVVSSLVFTFIFNGIVTALFYL